MSGAIKVEAVTADTAIVTGRGMYYGCRITGDGTNPAQVLVYDGIDATGTLIDDIRCTSTASQGEQFFHARAVVTGIFVDVTTVGRVVVWFDSPEAA